uniref:Uncharacterized protein n=1 Tax=Knipowitschia caucasica TaxID=637954 RepID=A0AAV2JW69_KNICA
MFFMHEEFNLLLLCSEEGPKDTAVNTRQPESPHADTPPPQSHFYAKFLPLAVALRALGAGATRPQFCEARPHKPLTDTGPHRFTGRSPLLRTHTPAAVFQRLPQLSPRIMFPATLPPIQFN